MHCSQSALNGGTSLRPAGHITAQAPVTTANPPTHPVPETAERDRPRGPHTTGYLVASDGPQQRQRQKEGNAIR